MAKGYQIYKIVKEIGSGVDDKRKKLTDLLQDDNYRILVVEHKDRLTRFGFNYLKVLLGKVGKEIEVVNEAEDDAEGLVQDLVAIVYSFSARLYGPRRAKRKTRRIVEEFKKDAQVC